MSNPSLAESLTADGVDLTRSDGRILIRVTEGLGEVWEVRGSDTVLPSADGQVPRNRKRHKLDIIAEGHVLGAGADEAAQRGDLVDLMASIRNLMDPTQDPYTLSVGRQDGSTQTISARPQNAIWGDDSLPSYRVVSLKWVAVEDDWA